MYSYFIGHTKKQDKIFFSTIIDYIIFIMFLLYSLVDCLTGMSKVIGIPSIGVPYKLLLIFFMIISCKSNKIIVYSYFFSIIFLSAFFYFFRPTSSLMESLSMMLRIIMCPFLYVYIKDTYFKLSNYKNYFNVIFSVNFFTVVVNQFFGILGFGGSTYSDGGFGIKGFFYDGNALAVVCFSFFVFYLSMNVYKKRSLVIFICACLLATKTAILSIVLYFFYHILNKTKRRFKVAIFILFLIIVSVFVYLIFYTDTFSYHVDKFKRMYELFDGNLIDVLLSGRSRDLQQHFSYYSDNFSISQLLFGYGYRSNVKIIELDFFDTLFSYGLFTFLPTFLFYIFLWYKNRKRKNISFYNFLFFLFSITVGHVWYNTSAALFFVIINLYYGDNKNEKSLLYK